MRSVTLKVAAPTVFAVTAWTLFIGAMLAAAPLLAGSDITRNFDAGAYTDGCGSDWDGCRDRLLEGAASAVSDDGNTPRNGDAGGHVTVNVTGGTYSATVGAAGDTPDGIYRFSRDRVGFSDPWSTGILAASFGVDGRLQTNMQSLYNGGNGGAVTVVVGNPSANTPVTVELGGNLPALAGRLTLTGVMALSQGGVNSYMDANPSNYSESGDGGSVNVDFKGVIQSYGSYASSAGDLIAQEIGISAISRGGAFRCIDEDCGDNYKSGYNYNLPGQGGQVDVTLHAVPSTDTLEIDLQKGAAIGVMAVSSNGAIIADQDDAGFNVDASSVRAGTVSVTIGEAADANAVDIRVGKAGSAFGMGVLAVSSGSEATVPLYYQNGNVTLRPSGGSGFGNNVTVNNDHGAIDAQGDSALGIVALSLGGEAAIGLRGITQPGVYEVGKKHPDQPDVSAQLGNVTVTNGEKSTITTNGAGAHGIVAASLASGGITYLADVEESLQPDHPDPNGDVDGDGLKNVDDNDMDGDGVANLDDTDDDNDGLLDDPCKSEAPGEEPYCAGVQTAYVVGASGGGSPRKGGAVNVYNYGSIVTGDANNLDAAYHAMGIFAQSVGGGGGSSTGGFWFFHGDAAGNGGDGGAVSVENGGSIRTYGHFSTGVMAQSIGGGGGSSGDNTGIFVSVGGQGGRGGYGDAVNVTLGGAGTIQTEGAFAQGVVAQSIGGGGGKGGSASANGLFFSLAVGGAGGDGGYGRAVTVKGLKDTSDVVYEASADHLNAMPDKNRFEIWTEGSHAVGILAQSIGGGGGSGGGSESSSLGVLLDINMAFGGRGGAGGSGGIVTVDSALDIYSAGDDAMGIVAQSIGGGGGSGGHAYTNTTNVEVASVGDFIVPNGSFVASFGGKGGTGNAAGDVTVTNGGMVWTDGEQATGILAQSVGGGGGSGGDAKAMNRSLPVKLGKDSYVIALDVTLSVGGNGGTGGDAGDVIVHNAYADPDSGLVSAGHVLTRSDNSIGILAQAIGGGGGNGGAGDASAYTLLISKLVTDKGFTWIREALSGVGSAAKFPDLNFKWTQSVGGSGGAGGDGGYVEAYNGEQTQNTDGTFAITPGTIQTLGGNSPGMVVQSIGGGGGNGGSSAVNGIGGLLDLNLAIGGDSGAAGDGREVYALNPAGATISTGAVLTLQSSEEDVANGASPFYLLTKGAGSVGILAQSIGGGGGAGGSADASSAITNGWSSIAVDVIGAWGFIDGIEALVEDGSAALVENLLKMVHGNLNLSLGGKGGAGGNGDSVLVDNGGTIATLGEQAFGIHAQSIGGGGGSGASTESTDPTVWAWINAVEDFTGVTFGVSVGGGGGAAGNGGTVTINHFSGGRIETRGSTAHAILAQSIGGGGGFGGMSANSGEGLVYLGLHWDGDQGASGYGNTVTVDSAGTIETFGNDSNGILAQSIGNGGGTAAAPCTNTAGISGQSPCWGNNQSTVPFDKDEWSDGWGYKLPLKLSIGLGGGKSDQTDTGEDGGNVTVNVTGDITTHGVRSMGVVAQSIGGGGGYFSADRAGLQEVDIAPSAGYSHSHGRTVAVDVRAAITTDGDGAWGVLAQSIGGSGGFAGDSSLDLGKLTSNTVPVHCCAARLQFFSTGADGGEVDVRLHSGATITTTGKNAHGIVAQSAGGGGGFAAYWNVAPDWEGDDNKDGTLNKDDQTYWDAHRPDSLWGGNPTASDWLGQKEDVWWTGQGGAINVTIDSGAEVKASGEGSVGILAQSTGNDSFMSKVSISVSGMVSGGSGSADPGTVGPAAILIAGGESRRNQHDTYDTPNSVRVTQGGTVIGHLPATGFADLNAVAIRATSGYTDVYIESGGIVWGGLILGDLDTGSSDLGYVFNQGTWWLGVDNLVAAPSNFSVSHNGIYNEASGKLVIGQTSVLRGGLSSVGTVEFHNPVAESALLTVHGPVMLQGNARASFDTSLSNQWYWLIDADSLSVQNLTVTGSLKGNSLTYTWNTDASNGNLRVQPVGNFTSAPGVSLGNNEASGARYLQQAWDNNDPYFGRQFAYMLGLQTEEQYAEVLDALGAPEFLHHQNATLRALPTLLGDVIDCPRTGGADVLLGEGTCAWMQGGRAWGRYRGNDSPKGDMDGDLYSMGLQKELSSGWFVGGVLGRLNSDIESGDFRGSGHTNVGAIGLKRESGRWLLGGSFAYGKGSYDSIRGFSMPMLTLGAPAPDAGLRSDSEMGVVALRMRASYAFGSESWYLRPTLELDLARTDVSDFEETAAAGGHPFLLRAKGETRTGCAATPRVELGMQRRIGKTMQLHAYLDAGVRLAPDADREIALQVAGADAADGYFRNRIDTPLATGLFKVGAQIYREDALDLRVEYGLESNGDFRNQGATARVAWHF